MVRFWFLTTPTMTTKHRLSKEQQVAGLRKALRSPRTPPQLKPSIKRYLAQIKRGLQREGNPGNE